MKNCRLHTFAAMTALFCLTLMTATSCSSDEDMPGFPESVISLNMMDESNGKTKLGDSNVYINDANNFTSSSSSSVIASLGMGGSYTESPVLTRLAKEVAVAPGEFFQIFNDGDMRIFASGKRALSVDATYYNLYVADWINNDEGKHIGARVSYNMLSMESGNLPGWNEVVCTLTHGEGANSSWTDPSEAVCTFPTGSEINVDYNGWENYLIIEVDGGNVTVKFSNNRPRRSGHAYLYVRDGGIYTRAIIDIKYVTHD